MTSRSVTQLANGVTEPLVVSGASQCGENSALHGEHVIAGEHHTCAMLVDGKVSCWVTTATTASACHVVSLSSCGYQRVETAGCAAADHLMM